MTRIAQGLAGVTAVALLTVIAVPLLAQGKLNPYPCGTRPCDRVANAWIALDASPNGIWSLGTTGGDANTPADDGVPLMYGYVANGTSLLGSSYPTIRFTGPGGTSDSTGGDFQTLAQDTTTDTLRTRWRVNPTSAAAMTETLEATQTLRLAANPFSGNPDAVLVRYDVRNTSGVTLSVGVRALIDVQVGGNDGAP